MAYSASNLRRIDGSPGVALYTYTTSDTYVGTVDQSNYFLSAFTDYGLAKGDRILCVSATGGTPTGKSLVVTAASSTTVTTAAFA